jgi:hypothetical protein
VVHTQKKRGKLKTLQKSKQNLVFSFMKRSEVKVENLLNQLSEEKINRVVDSQVVKAGWSSKSCHSGNSNDSECNSGGGSTGGGSSSGTSGGANVSGGATISIGASGSGGLGLGF